MATTDTTRRDRQRFWVEHVQAAAASGLTLKEYATREGLAVTQLYGWRRSCKRRGLLGQAPAADRFVPVQVVADPACAPLRLVFPDGLALEFGEAVTEATLRRVLAGLGWAR
jgi:hypothetical protein